MTFGCIHLPQVQPCHLEFLPSFPRRFPNIRSLAFARDCRLAPQSLACAARCSALTSLSLAGVTFVEVPSSTGDDRRNAECHGQNGAGTIGNALAALAAARALRHLNVSGCQQASRVDMARLADLTDLESLSLAGCSSVDDKALAAILPALSKVTDLDLTGVGYTQVVYAVVTL